MSLPAELDFIKSPEASKERMNLAMEYIVAKIRALEAINPEFQSVIDELKVVGLERVTEALLPIFNDAQTKADAIAALLLAIQTDASIEEVTDNVTENVIAEFADYRHRYLGAKAAPPTVREDGSPVAVGDMYFDTSLDAMRVLGQSGWKNAGSSVAGVLRQITPIVATEGQTVFTIPDGYDPGYLILTIDGAVIPPTDYTATNGTSVTLTAGIPAGTELAGVAFGAVTLANAYNKAQVDAVFRTIADSYTKSQVDALVAAGSSASYTKAQSDGRYANQSLSNLPDASAARGNLGLGSAAVRSDTYFAKSSEALGQGQSWQGVTRTVGTPYQNTTSRPIMVSVQANSANSNDRFEVSADGVNWFIVSNFLTNAPIQVIVPAGHWYRANASGSAVFAYWTELR